MLGLLRSKYNVNPVRWLSHPMTRAYMCCSLVNVLYKPLIFPSSGTTMCLTKRYLKGQCLGFFYYAYMKKILSLMQFRKFAHKLFLLHALLKLLLDRSCPLAAVIDAWCIKGYRATNHSRICVLHIAYWNFDAQTSIYQTQFTCLLTLFDNDFMMRIAA